MAEKSKNEKFLNKHIKNIVREFDFEVRSKKHPNACPLYRAGKPCHKMQNLNCFLCYCPNYDTSRPEGGCKIGSKKGKWLYRKKLPKGKIWDCSDCIYPHQKSVVEKHIKFLFLI